MFKIPCILIVHTATDNHGNKSCSSICKRDKGAEVGSTKNLGVFKRKILRRLYGALWDREVWRIRNNHELRELYGKADIVAAVKPQRLRWLGHMMRMGSD